MFDDLKKIRKVGDDKYTACCPCHDDDRESLTISRKAGADDWIVHCFAGCDWRDIKKAIGISRPTEAPGKKTNRQPTAYDYRDENGILLYQVFRGYPKKFWQQLPDGTKKLGDVRRVIYRLPELIASKPSAVFIVEGEKDVEALRAWGLTATCSTGGAGKWQSDTDGLFADRPVFILPDNDEPGRAYAQLVKRGIPHAVIVALPGLPEKGDVSDWIADGGTIEKLRVICRDAKQVAIVKPYDAWLQDLMNRARSGTLPADFAPSLDRYADHKSEVMAVVKSYNLLALATEAIRLHRRELKQSAQNEIDVQVNHATGPDGETYLLPTSCYIRDGKTYFSQATEQGPREIALCPCVLLVTKLQRQISTGLCFVAVAWCERGQWQKIIVPRETIADTHRITTLTRHGLPITSICAKMIVNYLALFIEANELPTERIALKQGKLPDGWVIGETCLTDSPTVYDGQKLGIEQQGSLEEYLDVIDGIQHHPGALIAWYASIASPLCVVYGADGFVIDYHGKTTVGKTTSLKIAASVWGNFNLIQKWNTTEYYREQQAAALQNYPLLLDDHKDFNGFRVDGDHPITKSIYQLADGIGRGRGKKDGGFTTPDTWRLITFSTGEQSLLDYDQSEGSAVRCISFQGSPFSDGASEYIRKLRGLREHYGHIGRLAIENINTVDLSRYRFWREQYLQGLSSEKLKTGIADRVCSHLAVIHCAAEWIHAICKLPWEFDQRNLIATLLSTASTVNKADRTSSVLEDIHGIIEANPERLSGKSQLEQWGYRELGKARIYPFAFAEICKRLNASPSAIRRDLGLKKSRESAGDRRWYYEL